MRTKRLMGFLMVALIALTSAFITAPARAEIVGLDKEVRQTLNTEIGTFWVIQSAPQYSFEGGFWLTDQITLIWNGELSVRMNGRVLTDHTTVSMEGDEVVLVIDPSQGAGLNTSKIVFNFEGDSLVSLRMARCSCFGGTAATVKRACTDRECRDAGISCRTGGTGTAHCVYRGASNNTESGSFVIYVLNSGRR